MKATTSQVVKLPVNNADSKSGNANKNKAGEKKQVKPLTSNLSPEAKSVMGRSSKAQLLALVASVPLFTAMGYGAAKADMPAADEHDSGALAKGGEAASHLHQMDVAKSFPPEYDFHPMLSTQVTDDMSFQDAFETAREELGGGNFFIWNGNLYGTFYQEEWEALSEDQQAAYLEALPQENLPDFVESFGLPPVLVVEDPIVPVDEVVVDNAVLQFNENGEPTLNEEQVEIIAEHNIDDMTDAEKMDMLLRAYANGTPEAETADVTEVEPALETTETDVPVDEALIIDETATDAEFATDFTTETGDAFTDDTLAAGTDGEVL